MPSGSTIPARCRALLVALLASVAVLVAGASTASAATHDLRVSKSSSRSNSVALDQTTQSGSVYIFTDKRRSVKQIEYRIDGVSQRVERWSPYDLAGTATSGDAKPLDTESLSNGDHTVTARVTRTSGSRYDLDATMTVDNAAPVPIPVPDPIPDPIPTPPPPTDSSRLYGLNGVPGWSGWDDAKTLGAKVLRYEFDYDANPAGYDAQFTAAAQRGQMLLPLINGPGNKYTSDFTALANYSAALSARYGPGGTYWRAHPEFSGSLAPRYFEVWNEPYGNWYDTVNPPAYVRMLKAIVDAGRDANPASRYLLPAVVLPGYTDGRATWVDDIYRAEPNLNAWFDGIATHPYSGNKPPDDPGIGMATQLDNLESKFRAHGAGDKPIWITEMGWGTCTGNSQCVSESTQASYYSKLFSLLKSRPEVTGLLTYNFRGNGSNQSSPEQFYGLERGDGSHKPAFDVYRAAATGG